MIKFEIKEEGGIDSEAFGGSFFYQRYHYVVVEPKIRKLEINKI